MAGPVAAGCSASGERTGSWSSVSAGAGACDGLLGGCCAHSGSVVREKRIAQVALLQWRIVAGTSMDSELRQSRWRIKLHFHFTPLAIPVHVLGRVADYILVT